MGQSRSGCLAQSSRSKSREEPFQDDPVYKPPHLCNPDSRAHSCDSCMVSAAGTTRLFDQRLHRIVSAVSSSSSAVLSVVLSPCLSAFLIASEANWGQAGLWPSASCLPGMGHPTGLSPGNTVPLREPDGALLLSLTGVESCFLWRVVSCGWSCAVGSGWAGPGVAGPFLTVKSKLCFSPEESSWSGRESEGSQKVVPAHPQGFKMGKEKVFAEEKWQAPGRASDRLSLLPSQRRESVTLCQVGRKRTEFLPSLSGGLPASLHVEVVYFHPSRQPSEVSVALPLLVLSPLLVKATKPRASAPLTSDEWGTHFSCRCSMNLSIQAVPV